ncbi:MAG: hypothetical protein ABR898_16635 [Terracidiphilus sp.]|jgi:hypothetical protein
MHLLRLDRSGLGANLFHHIPWAKVADITPTPITPEAGEDEVKVLDDGEIGERGDA